MKINHYFFESVAEDGDLYRVTLRSEFPIHTFSLRKSQSEGYPSVDSDLGIVDEGNEIDWVHGVGGNYDEAVIEALIYFVNLVVSPEGLSEGRFAWRDINA